MSPAGIEVHHSDKVGRMQQLQTLCETRWISRSYSLFTHISVSIFSYLWFFPRTIIWRWSWQRLYE